MSSSIGPKERGNLAKAVLYFNQSLLHMDKRRMSIVIHLKKSSKMIEVLNKGLSHLDEIRYLFFIQLVT